MSDARKRTRRVLRLALLGLLAASGPLSAADYQAITPTEADKTITLTGRELTVEQLVDIARRGAKVQLGAEAKQRQSDNYGLLLEAAAEGVAVYWFNRGAGDSVKRSCSPAIR
jgi:histidine ammonia-lyase